MLKDTLLFLGQMARRWRTMGAIAPSGGVLARTIARKVGELPEGRSSSNSGRGRG